jgi:hypothetical protein
MATPRETQLYDRRGGGSEVTLEEVERVLI